MECSLNEQVAEELRNIFIPELITVTENPKAVEELQKEVNIIISPMEDLTFDPFIVETARDWAFVTEEFREDVTVSTIYCDSQKSSTNKPDNNY